MSKNIDFSELDPISYKSRVRIGIGRKIEKTRVEWDKNKLTHASHALGQAHSQVPLASAIRARFSAAVGRRSGSGAMVQVDRGYRED